MTHSKNAPQPGVPQQTTPMQRYPYFNELRKILDFSHASVVLNQCEPRFKGYDLAECATRTKGVQAEQILLFQPRTDRRCPDQISFGFELRFKNLPLKDWTVTPSVRSPVERFDPKKPKYHFQVGKAVPLLVFKDLLVKFVRQATAKPGMSRTAHLFIQVHPRER